VAELTLLAQWMPIVIRPAPLDDLLDLQDTNLHCLAENYDLGFWIYHMMLSPGATHVARSADGRRTLGYVLAKYDDEDRKRGTGTMAGGITSVAVYSRVRRMAIGTRLLGLTHNALRDSFLCDHALLHVRQTNTPGQHLYARTFKYQTQRIDEGYFADGENAIAMKLQLVGGPSKGGASGHG
jgi:peptide alpha-N-acetyltransferase